MSFAAFGVHSDLAADERPNILFILADDVGQEVLGCYGGTSYDTPNLDALAKSGTRFRNAYVMPVCHPTRITLLTGRYPFRFGGPQWGSFPERAECRTFAAVLRQAGYATAIAGKWQLALLRNDPQHPHRLGFDEYCLFGWHEGPRYWQPLLWQNGSIRDDVTDRYGPEVYSDFLIDFMSRHRDSPFLAFYSMALCHDVTDDLDEPVAFAPGKDRYESYAEMAENMDRMVGKLVRAVEELGLREHTLILFLTDNGTASSSIIDVRDGNLVRAPVVSRRGGEKIRGGKGKLTDAGTRVPLVASWPGTTPAGIVVDDLVDASDILPTFGDLAGVSPPEELSVDGSSFAPRLRGKGAEHRRWVYAEHRGQSWVRTRRWKLYDDGRLYDMRSDSRESSPIAPGGSTRADVARQRLSHVFGQLRTPR